MKRLLALLLTLALLTGLSGTCFANGPGFADSVAPQAIGVALACYELNRYDGDPLLDEVLAPQAAAWYAAFRFRRDGVDLLTEAEVLDFERSLGFAPETPIPDYWEGGIVNVLKSADGTRNLDFDSHKRRLDDMLGQTLELRIEDAGENAVRLTLIRHFTDDQAASYPFELRFVPNEDEGSAFAWKLAGVTEPSYGPQLDPELTFDWDLLLEQNRLSTLLDVYDSVQLENEYAPDMPTWLFRKDGQTVGVTGDGVTYASGEYRGCSYVREKDDEGGMRTRVSEADVVFARDDANEAWITCWLEDIAVLKLIRIEDGLLWARGVTGWGSPVELCLDYGTLALRELSYYTDSGERTGGTKIHYDAELPDFSFLDAWEGPLRTVTAVREDWYTGERNVRTETVELPADWEYLPWEGIYGDYTIYMDEGYTKPYAYPGDGLDYTLYLTTAKG